MSPSLLAIGLLCVGVVLAVVGRFVRRGGHAVCGRCGFDLTGSTTAERCPECGRSLAARRAVAKGDRFRTPGRVGIAVALLSLPVFAYAVLDDPTLDPKKPVWLLAAEHRLFGESREARLLDELERRTAAVPTSEAERLALAGLALAGADSIEADARWHGLVVRALQTGTLPADRLAPRAERMLREYAALSAQDAERLADVAADYARLPSDSDAAIQPLLGRVEGDYVQAETAGAEAIEAWERGSAREVLSAWFATNHALASGETMNRVVGELDAVELRVKPKSPVGESLPMRIDLRPRLLAYGSPAWLRCELRDIRINGVSLHEGTGHQLAAASFGASRGGASAMSFTEPLPDDLGPGPYVAEVDIEIAVQFAGKPEGEIPPGKLITRSREFSLVERVEAIDWVTSDDADDARRMLESIGVIDARYFTGDSAVQTRRFQFPIQILDPPFDVVHALWAEQGDRRWRIGTIVVPAGRNTMTTLSGPLDRLVQRDGRVVNDTQHPDFGEPVRMVLRPDDELILRQIDEVAPWGHPIDLGDFTITETDQISFGAASFLFVPPPALEASGEPAAAD